MVDTQVCAMHRLRKLTEGFGMSSEQSSKNVGGRPSERDEPKRAAIAVRTTPTIKARLSDAAEARGRSITQEVEARIEQSFDLEDSLGGPQTMALMIELARQIAKAEVATGKAWHRDTKTHRAGLKLVETALKASRPRPEKYDEGQRLAQELSKASKRFVQTTSLLQDSGVITDARNALLARFDDEPVWKVAPEKHWHFPDDDGRKLTQEDMNILRDILKEWEELREVLATLKGQVDAIMGPHFAEQRAGDELAEKIIRGEA